MRTYSQGLTFTGVLVLLTAACAREQPASGGHDGHAVAAPAAGSDTTSAAGAVTLAAADRARLGITLATAEVRSLTREVRLVGRLVPAETAVRTVTSRVDGFVERLHVDFTGRAVRQGESLLELYSPALVAAQQELLLALRLRSGLTASSAADAQRDADSLVAASRRRLALWDIDAEQIADLERRGAVQRTMTIRAPVGGIVLQKSVVEGQAISAGAPLFSIADLMMVWLEADVFESDLAAVRVGQEAAVTFDAYPGETHQGTVGYVYPTVDPVARTGRVRIELHNHEGRLRPGLFGTVRIVAALGARGVVIPRQAALVTGDRQLVFVEDSAGRFVPRLVTLGVETDALVEVRSGLRAGERVVATAAFLLDAEANLGAAMAGMPAMDMGGPSGAKAPAPPAGTTGHRH